MTRRLWPGLALAALALPAIVFLWLLANPRRNVEILALTEHFLIVTNVSALALGTAALLARLALQIGQHRLLLVALGFMCLAGLFMVHALATPGMLVGGHVEDYGGTVIGLSAYLSLFVPSVFFAAHTLPPSLVPPRWTTSPRALLIGVVGGLVLYTVLAIVWAPYVGRIPLSQPPLSYTLAGVTVVLLLVAAWAQLRETIGPARGWQWVLAVAFVFLAEAQVSMVLAPLWTLAWWEYHVLMLVGVVIALAALYGELDRRRAVEARRQQDELVAARSQAEALQQAEAVRSEIISIVSHELRTPLTAMRGFSELLLTRSPTEEERRLWLTTMHAESVRLAEIVDDLLDVARVDSGRVRLNLQPVRLDDIARHVAATLGPQSARHRIAIHCLADGLVVLGDAERLTQVLHNLVSNAIKYSPGGGQVEIVVRPDADRVLVSVTDQGLGIPAEEIPRLFTRFHRVTAADRMAIRGTGLGLYITRQLVELHGGQIWVDSTVGVGTSFTFSLPIDRSPLASGDPPAPGAGRD